LIFDPRYRSQKSVLHRSQRTFAMFRTNNFLNTAGKAACFAKRAIVCP
jgi:hypothetical protein